MVISRRYEPFIWLYNNDPYAKAILEKVYSESGWPRQQQEEHWDIMVCHRISVDNAEMGTCIPDLEYIIEQFEKLDKEHPYDNGFSVADVNKVHIIDQSTTTLHLELHNIFDGEDRLIGFAFIEKDNLLTSKPDDLGCCWEDWR